MLFNDSYIRQIGDNRGVPKESEPLSFLEKSHCVPIILALHRKGMMNRNQLYNELKETINVVIKRIPILIDLGLVFEKEMPVKPLAKYIGLTGKGKAIAEKLEEMESIMEKPGTGHIGHLHIPLVPDIDEEEMCKIESSKPPRIQDLRKEYKELITCPICKSERYLIEIKGKETWICPECGTKFDSTIEEAFNMLYLENHLQPKF